MTVTTATIERASSRAQRRFHRMVVDQTMHDPTDRRTRLYVQAERLLDRLIGERDEFALEVAADWRMVALAGDYTSTTTLPDVPLAAIPEGEARAMWGNR